MSPLQESVEKRKMDYLEKMLRGVFLTHGAWNGRGYWLDEAVKKGILTEEMKNLYYGNPPGEFENGGRISVCDALGYQEPSIEVYGRIDEEKDLILNIEYEYLDKEIDDGKGGTKIEKAQIKNIMRGIQRMEYLKRKLLRARSKRSFKKWDIPDIFLPVFENSVFSWLGFPASYLEVVGKDKITSLTAEERNALKDKYWEEITNDSISHLKTFKDTADFHANHLIRLVYLYGALPIYWKGKAHWREDNLSRDNNFSEKIENKIKDYLASFKYWLDEEPFIINANTQDASKIFDENDPASNSNQPIANALYLSRTSFPDGDKRSEMTFWSENHIILFSTAEFLVGQLYNDAIFIPGFNTLKVIAEEHQVNNRDRFILDLKNWHITKRKYYTAQERIYRGKKRIIRWLNERIKFGFSEWNAPGYYEEDIFALLNLIDFSLDGEIQQKATIVLDLLFFDMARFTLNGNFGVTSGRCYLEQKNCGWTQPVGDLLEILFGTRNGIFSGGTSPAATYFVSSRRYGMPDALIAIGNDEPEYFIDRSRVSIDFAEAPKYGIGFESDDDIFFWWSKSAFFAYEIQNPVVNFIYKYGLDHTSPLKSGLKAKSDLPENFDAGYLPIDKDTNLHEFTFKIIVRLALEIPIAKISGIEGTIYGFIYAALYGSFSSRTNIYTFRNKSSMLSSVQNYNSGLVSFQSHFCQGTLDLGAVVWTSAPFFQAVLNRSPLFSPVHKELLPLSHDGPGYWTGSRVIPKVVQMKNAAIIAYVSNSDFSELFPNEITHAWFPEKSFHEKPLKSKFLNPLAGEWVFGRIVHKNGNEGYIGLYSLMGLLTPQEFIDLYKKNFKPSDVPDPYYGTIFDGREFMAFGKHNIFILQVGDNEEFGSFDKFKNALKTTRIELNLTTTDDILFFDIDKEDLYVSYDIPRIDKNGNTLYERLEMFYTPEFEEDNVYRKYINKDNKVRFNGKDFSDDFFPRFENIYIHRKNQANPGMVKWGQHHYTIKLGNHSLTHDCRALEYRNKNKKLSVYRYLDVHHKETYSITSIKIKIEPGLKPYADADSDIYFDIGPISGKIISTDPQNRNLDESVHLASIPQFWSTTETELDTLEIPFQEEDILWFRFCKKDNPWKVLLRRLLTEYNPTNNPNASLEERLALIIRNYSPSVKQDKSPALQKIEEFIAFDDKTKFRITLESDLDRAKRFLDDSWSPGKITIFLDDLPVAETIPDHPLTPQEPYLLIPFNVKDANPIVCTWNEQIWYGNKKLGLAEIQFAKSMSMKEITGAGASMNLVELQPYGVREDPGSFGAYEKPGDFGAYEKPGNFGGRENPGSFGSWEKPNQSGGYGSYEKPYPTKEDNIQNLVVFDPNYWISSQLFIRIIVEGISVNQYADFARIEIDGVRYIYAFYNVEVEWMVVNGVKIDFGPDMDIEHPRYLRVGHVNMVSGGWGNPGELIMEYAKPFQRLQATGQLVWNFYAGGFYELLVHRRSDILFKEKKEEWDV